MAARGSQFPPSVRRDDRDTRRLLEVAWSQHLSPSIDQSGSTWRLETESPSLFWYSGSRRQTRQQHIWGAPHLAQADFRALSSWSRWSDFTYHYRAWVLHLLVVFFFRTWWVTMHPGCFFHAWLTGTPLESTPGVLQFWPSSINSSVRLVIRGQGPQA